MLTGKRAFHAAEPRLKTLSAIIRDDLAAVDSSSVRAGPERDRRSVYGQGGTEEELRVGTRDFMEARSGEG